MALVFLAPYGVGVLSLAQAAAPAVTPASSSSATGTLYWNGMNVNTAPTPASAISWTFNTIANVKYVWVGPQVGTGVSQGFLVILFLGFPSYTKQEVQSAASGPAGGEINMTYDLTSYKWYLQGLFELHAYLENPGGNVLWSENFYVKVAQPYDLVVATVGLLLLMVLELYMIATVGPRAMDKTRTVQPQPTEPAEEEPPASGTSSTNPPPGKS